MKTKTECLESLQWHQLPVDAGQIVNRTYAVDGTYLYCRTHDQSDGEIAIDRAELDADDATEFEPWNGQLPACGEWEQCIRAEREYTLCYRDEYGSDDSESFVIPVGTEEEQDEAAWEAAEAAAEEWCRGGEWGDNGALVHVWYWWTDEKFETSNIERGLRVDIKPDNDALIIAAGGDTDCDHDWTSEGHGGCTENPGVWSTGGTSMKFSSHCKKCGLHRIEYSTGSQRNPGEHDTVEYTQPESWCADCQSEECECE